MGKVLTSKGIEISSEKLFFFHLTQEFKTKLGNIAITCLEKTILKWYIILKLFEIKIMKKYLRTGEKTQ